MTSLYINPNTGDLLTPGLVGQVSHFAMKTAPAGWLACDGSAVGRVAYANLFAVMCPSRTVTVTVASPGVFMTIGAHGYSAGDVLYFTTTGALPTGLTAGTTAYYVISTGLTSTSFQVSTTSGGTAVNTSGTQSGIHTVYNAAFGFGNGSTTFTLPDLRGEFLRGWDNARGVDSGRVVGLLQTDAFQSHRHELVTGHWGISTTNYDSSWMINSQNFATNSTNNYAGTPFSDGVNGNPRLAGETRPRNVAVLACIKY
jgi:microcystin-dependent protein